MLYPAYSSVSNQSMNKGCFIGVDFFPLQEVIRILNGNLHLEWRNIWGVREMS